MQRRRKNATERLAVETVKSRESSEKLICNLAASIATLTVENVRACQGAGRAGRRLMWLTVVLVVFAVASVALTVVLAVRRKARHAGIAGPHLASDRKSLQRRSLQR